MSEETKLSKLIPEHQHFVILYVEYWNGRKAYQEVYPTCTEESARTNASRLLTNANVKEAVAEVSKTKLMPKEEILSRINSMAQINVQDYINDLGELDIPKIKEAGLGYMIKSISDTKFGKRIELHDQFKSLETLAKVHKLFDDKTEVTVNINAEKSAEDVLNERINTANARLQQYVNVGENSQLTQA